MVIKVNYWDDWSYSGPNDVYTPFDISDELELRNRFLLNHTGIDTRLEDWGVEFRNNTLSTPLISGGRPLDIWFKRAYDDGTIDPNYAYRHIATSYNMDRIINPIGPALNGGKMVNINTADTDLLYNTIRTALLNREPNVVKVEQFAAQLTANIIDLRDDDTEVTMFNSNSRRPY